MTISSDIVSEQPVVSMILAGGLDPSAGAGLAADLAAANEFGVVGLPIATALTIQDSQRCYNMIPVEPGTITAQLETVYTDARPRVIKIGLLGSAANASALADFLEKKSLAAIIDPVIAPSAGERFADGATIEILKQRLLALSLLVTPNIAEASEIDGKRIATLKDAEQAADRLRARGAEYVLIKGIPGRKSLITDVLVGPEGKILFSGQQRSGGVRGTGCSLAAAAAACLALGYDMAKAVREAVDYAGRKREEAVQIGQGAKQQRLKKGKTVRGHAEETR
ncbi:MAG: bifunctional hydroxymethylpyrimidine kinase/phosphomethylpyrimidine kinase [Actinomycetota bacterium]